MGLGWTNLVSVLLSAAPIILPIYEISQTYRMFSSAPNSPKARLIIAFAISVRFPDAIIVFNNK
jgi:hypothetical protein